MLSTGALTQAIATLQGVSSDDSSASSVAESRDVTPRDQAGLKNGKKFLTPSANWPRNFESFTRVHDENIGALRRNQLLELFGDHCNLETAVSLRLQGSTSQEYFNLLEHCSHSNMLRTVNPTIMEKLYASTPRMFSEKRSVPGTLKAAVIALLCRLIPLSSILRHGYVVESVVKDMRREKKYHEKSMTIVLREWRLLSSHFQLVAAAANYHLNDYLQGLNDKQHAAAAAVVDNLTEKPGLLTPMWKVAPYSHPKCHEFLPCGDALVFSADDATSESKFVVFVIAKRSDTEIAS